MQIVSWVCCCVHEMYTAGACKTGVVPDVAISLQRLQGVVHAQGKGGWQSHCGAAFQENSLLVKPKSYLADTLV